MAGALSQKVYDLDNTDEIAQLKSEGLQLDGVGAEENLKVASSNGVEGNGGGKDGKERSEESLDDCLVLAPTIVLCLPANWLLCFLGFTCQQRGW